MSVVEGMFFEDACLCGLIQSTNHTMFCVICLLQSHTNSVSFISKCKVITISQS